MMKAKKPHPQGKRAKSPEDVLSDEQLGQRIRELRKLLELEQWQFAERLGVSAPAVTQWEQGKGCTRYNLEKIVSEFNITRDWLYAGIGKMKARKGKSK